ncbi:Thiamine-phosphate synthase [Dyadobacter sp. CECT 9275]|uniref:Thiamine-phosphate synthase n=2 Tax=Dyadobacter helix TaxID=2822344 RepID=A0A916N3B4_9BACT|nr:Thiamine-phosphate synthase [Dyadobacter sp. CECT 9275]
MILEKASLAKNLCDSYGAKLIINDYPEVARDTGAFGVHLGLEDLPIQTARQMGGNMIIGGTANTLQDVLQRVQEGADYVGLGPYRFTNTKQNLSPVLGADGYRAILETIHQMNISIPVIAIGGITDEDITGLLSAGVHGVAMSAAITHSPDRKQFVTQLYKTLC